MLRQPQQHVGLLPLLPLLLLSSSATFLLFVHGAPNRIDFRIEHSKPRGNVVGLKFKNRFTLPYGPDLYNNQGYHMAQTSTDQPYRGYGVGMSAAEQIVFDPIQKYLYSMSDVGYIIIVDYEDMTNPQLTKLSFELEDDKLGSIDICPEQNMFFVTLEKLGRVDVYNLVNRTNPEIPTLLKSIDAGTNVKSVLPNKDCTLLAIANTNEGEELAQGSITILENFMMDNDGSGSSTSATATTTTGTDDGGMSRRRIFNSVTIPLDYNEWDDEYLLRRGLNMPLTLKALEYWDDHSDRAEELDFSNLRKNYKSAIFLEPERLAWNGPDETELLVNLQENNGLLRINMTDYRPVAVAGYGLKDHSVVPVDIQEDGECNLKTYGSLFSLRNPDAIQSIRYNGKHYVFTANEGGGKGYGDWEEELWTSNLFKVNNANELWWFSDGGFLCFCLFLATRSIYRSFSNPGWCVCVCDEIQIGLPDSVLTLLLILMHFVHHQNSLFSSHTKTLFLFFCNHCFVCVGCREVNLHSRK